MGVDEDGGTFKALVLTGPGKSEVRPQTAESLRCGPGEALVKVFAVGVCATDTELFDGSMAYLHSGFAAYPLVPGHEWSGEILQLGRGCPDHLKVGQHVVGEHATGCAELQRVTQMASEAPIPEPPPPPPAGGARLPKLTAAWSGGSCAFCALPGGFIQCPGRAETGFFRRDGGCAMRLRFPAHQLHIVPDSVPWPLAALAEPLSTAIKGVRMLGLPSVDSTGKAPHVGVVGEGTIGLLVVQVLVWRGFPVTVIGASPSRLEKAKELGASRLYDVTKVGPQGLRHAVEQDGPLLDYVVEGAGKPSAVAAALEVVAPGGRVVLMGLSGGKVGQIAWDDIVLRQVTVRGSLASEPEDWRQGVELIASGQLKSVVTHTLDGLESYEKAIHMVVKPPPDMLKLCLLVQEDNSGGPSQKRQRTA